MTASWWRRTMDTDQLPPSHERPLMPTITWKAALGGGLVAGAGFAGLAQAGDDRPTLPVNGVELQMTSATQLSPLSPSRLVTTTTVVLPVAPPVPALQVESVSGVIVAPVAPVAPVVTVATTTELPDICPGGDFTAEQLGRLVRRPTARGRGRRSRQRQQPQQPRQPGGPACGQPASAPTAPPHRPPTARQPRQRCLGRKRRQLTTTTRQPHRLPTDKGPDSLTGVGPLVVDDAALSAE